MGLLRTGELEDQTVVFAEDQKKGRGQRENIWVSVAQKSLTFSMFRRFDDLSIKDQFSISMAVSIGIEKTLVDHGIPNVTIKWPNDIMSRSGKLAGILIENQTKGSMIVSSVIGIGMNINEDQFDDLPKATSMYRSTGVFFSREELFHELLRNISEELDRLNKKELNAIHLEFENKLYKRAVVSVFREPQGGPFNGSIQGVSREGELMIECEDEKVRRYRMKEIEYLG
jgi:BirA family biotin operon repressor/biotin-[acetyl-CoA-carboxylase] ligase